VPQPTAPRRSPGSEEPT
jgi:hypothetical protein